MSTCWQATAPATDVSVNCKHTHGIYVYCFQPKMLATRADSFLGPYLKSRTFVIHPRLSWFSRRLDLASPFPFGHDVHHDLSHWIPVFCPGTIRKFDPTNQPNEMNPKLLLSYACERTVLPGGTRMFKHFATSTESQHLFVYMFWFIHCKFFQVWQHTASAAESRNRWNETVFDSILSFRPR